MRSPVAGDITVPLWVACHYAAGRATKQGPKHGCEYQAFAVLGRPACPLAVPKLAKEYRGRFGIETSYRVFHQVRARTTSREPALRLLLLTIAGLLSNLWVFAKALLVGRTARRHRRSARQWLDAMLRLDRWRDLLLDAIKAHYHVSDALHFPFNLTLSLQIGKY
jgi:putative transposase